MTIKMLPKNPKERLKAILKPTKPFLLSVGMNAKLAKNIGVFNLPPGVTCPGKTALCTGVCYAQKASRMYKAARDKRAWNLKESRKDTFTGRITSEIILRKIKMVRWHESGDVFSQGYLDKIFEVCTALPKVRFLMYTKSFMYDWSAKPDNLVVYWSMDKTTEHMPPDMPWSKIAALITEGDAPPPGFVTCQPKGKKEHYCGAECLTCWASCDILSVYFKQH